MKVFNIFDALERQEPISKNTSVSMVNTDFGMCPKCKNKMDIATNHDGEKVYYCEKCRVALPIEN